MFSKDCLFLINKISTFTANTRYNETIFVRGESTDYSKKCGTTDE